MTVCMYGSRGGDRVSGPPLKNHKNIGFLGNTGPEPLKNLKLPSWAIIGPPAKRHFTFCWMANDGPLIVVFGFLNPSSLKQKKKKKKKNNHFRSCNHSDITFWILRAWFAQGSTTELIYRFCTKRFSQPLNIKC